MTGKDYPAQTGHNDFIVREGKTEGYFMMVAGHESCTLKFCPGSHFYADYDKKYMER